MKYLLAAQVAIAILLAGCASDEKVQLVLPPAQEGNFCMYAEQPGEMTCNFDGVAILDSGEKIENISAGIPFASPKCKAFNVFAGRGGLSMEMIQGMVPVFPYKDEMMEINNATKQKTMQTRLANPCVMQAAFESGKLGRDYCFYNSTTKELACGRPLMLVREGNVYNISDAVETDFCGMAGLTDPRANETYLIFIFENNDQIIELNEETSKLAIGYQISGIECN